MKDIGKQPKGQKIMIGLGIFNSIYFLLGQLVVIYVFVFNNDLSFEGVGELFGPVQAFIFLCFNPFIISYQSIILFKLIRKDVEAIYMIRILIPIYLFLCSLSIVEGLYLRIVGQVFGLISLAIGIAVLLYWNNPSHIRYFKSLKIKG